MPALHAQPSAGEIRVYFGNLHAHSRLSDGHPSISPADAYAMARGPGGLDFLSLSEHNHMLTQDELDELVAAAKAATTDDFVALFGQEYSTLKTGFNHTNIHNYPELIPKKKNGKYKEVFETILPGYSASHPDQVIVAGFNHPKTLKRDYGLQKDYGGNWEDFVAGLDPIVQLIAVANGPSDSSSKELDGDSITPMMHRDISKGRWFTYLSHGMHLAPKIDHDTHSRTHGLRVAGCTGVWVRGALTKKKLLQALASRNCYATEDRNLRIVALINGTDLPGAIVESGPDQPLQVSLTITDDDEPTATYEIEVHSGMAGGGRPVHIEDFDSTRVGDGTVAIDIPVELDVPVYFVIHVKQESVDPINGSAVNDAWLAPIFTGESSASDDDLEDAFAFVSSKNSKVYHYPECNVVKKIKPSNLRYHDTAPDTKRLHKGCPW